MVDGADARRRAHLWKRAWWVVDTDRAFLGGGACVHLSHLAASVEIYGQCVRLLDPIFGNVQPLGGGSGPPAASSAYFCSS